jgi:hypothetical protein
MPRLAGVHHEFGGERQFADATTCGIEDGVGDRACGADLADLADTFPGGLMPLFRLRRTRS